MLWHTFNPPLLNRHTTPAPAARVGHEGRIHLGQPLWSEVAKGLAIKSQASAGSTCCCLGSGAMVRPAQCAVSGETANADVSPQCLAAVPDPGVLAQRSHSSLPVLFSRCQRFPAIPLPCCLSESWIGSHAHLAIDSCCRAARPGYRCQPFEKPRSLSLLGLARGVPSLDPRSIRLAIADHYASSLHLTTGPTGPSASTSVVSSGGGPLGWGYHDAVSDSRAGGRRGYS